MQTHKTQNELLWKLSIGLLIVVEALVMFIFTDLRSEVDKHEDLITQLEISVKLLEDNIKDHEQEIKHGAI
jgi:hypothetical protein